MWVTLGVEESTEVVQRSVLRGDEPQNRPLSNVNAERILLVKTSDPFTPGDMRSPSPSMLAVMIELIRIIFCTSLIIPDPINRIAA